MSPSGTKASWRTAQIVVWVIAIALMPVFPDQPIFGILAFVAVFLFPFHIGFTMNHLPTRLDVEPDEPIQLRLRSYESDKTVHVAPGPTDAPDRKDEGSLREPSS